MQVIQLDFFEKETEEQRLNKRLDELKASCDKMRKALFARHGELAKKYMELHERMEVIEKHICKG